MMHNSLWYILMMLSYSGESKTVTNSIIHQYEIESKINAERTKTCLDTNTGKIITKRQILNSLKMKHHLEPLS
jgi:hypothetical protein